MKKLSFGIIYEVLLVSLVIISLVINLPANQSRVLDWFIWSIFMVDYVVRVILAKDKWKHIKSNPLDLIALIPLDQIFRTIRIVRLVRTLRLIAIFERKNSLFKQLLDKYNIDKLLIILIVLMFSASLSMKWLEPSIHTYGEALWWSVVTMTTVGYGDYYPVTSAGRIIAGFLMFTGITLIGTITGTVAAFLTSKENKDTSLPLELRYIMEKIEQYPDINPAEYRIIQENLKLMEKKEKEAG
ncbi:potassium channel family protein [Heyndrickxia sp. NPDC080065]|uniref:potassium channel family protein n=1 Tax=Heyndrickxia sp. NPDC080065 TaxID=3390568 RepID=UPI003D021303